MKIPNDRGEDALAGTARLSVLIIVTIISFIYSAVLEYGLPLYFNALGDYPKMMWTSQVVRQVATWASVPILDGMLAKRFGECRVWATALVGQAIVPLALVIVPRPWMVAPVAVWSGVTGAAAWLSGISLVQVVPPQRKGYANGLMMMSLGVGSLVGPLVARGVLWSRQVSLLIRRGDWPAVGAFLVNLTKPEADPPMVSFRIIFIGIGALSLLAAAAVWLYGQRAGQMAGELIESRRIPGITDIRRLLTNPRFWGLALSLSLFGGPVFQATNQFLRYRAEDLGLISGPLDQGWIILQLVRPLMWVPGGLAVGLLAGRRAPGFVAATILGCYALAGAGIGLAQAPLAFVRGGGGIRGSCVNAPRWSQTGYMSEHMPADLRSTAIGCAITFSSLGGGTFGFIANSFMTADAVGFESARPFWVASRIGLAGALGLLIFDRFVPIRRPGEGRGG